MTRRFNPGHPAWCVEAWLLLLSSLSASATTYHVDPAGTDSAPGSETAPWRTLQHAVEQVQPGDRILVRSGRYSGARIERSGRRRASITLRAAPEASVLLDRPSQEARHGSILEVENFEATVSHWTIEGFEIAGAARSGIDIRAAHRITVRANRVHDSGLTGIFTAFVDDVRIEGNESFANGEHGIYVSNSGDRPLIRQNLVYDNAASGIHMNGDLGQGGDGVISRAKVDRNVLFGNGRAGGSAINMDGVDRAKVRNNLIFDQHASGISLYQIDGGICTSNTKVYNNTVVVASDGQWAFNMPDPGCIGNRLINNILLTEHTFRGSIAIYDASAQDFVSHHNVVMDRFSVDAGDSVIPLNDWQALGYGRSSFISRETELFVDARNGDFELRAGSPAQDAGKRLKSVRRDLLRRKRTFPWDVGAYESAAGGVSLVKILSE